MQHWDTTWYVQIVTQGYQADDGTAQFHPLFPLLARGPTALGLNPLLSLLLISSAAGLVGVYWYQKLALLDFSVEEVKTSLIMFFFWPVSFVLFIPYTEALFFLLSVMCLYFARQQKWWIAGFMGALAVLTRQQGILLVIPLAWELWEVCQRDLRLAMRRVWTWFAVGLIPLANLGWIFFRALILNDFNGAVLTPADLIYRVLISPSSVHVVPFRIMVPWQAVWIGVQKLINDPDIDIWTNLTLALLFLFFCVAAWPHLRLSYRLYTLAVVGISLTYQTGYVHPYMGLVRHLWLAFPVFLGMGRSLAVAWQRLLYVSLGLGGVIFLLGLYIFEAWVP